MLTSGMLLTLAACQPKPPPPSTTVLFLVDTLRADAVAQPDPTYDATPFLDDLARDDATNFTRAYASSSWTLSSTATLVTGLMPWEHRVVRAAGGDKHCFGRLREDIPTAGSVHRQRGWRTGVWLNNAFLAPDFRLWAGFDHVDFKGADPVGHRTAMETVELALAWLDQEPTEPAFLLVHVMEPHFDYDPDIPFAGTFSEGMPTSLTRPIGPAVHTQWMNAGTPAPPAQDQAYLRAMYAEEVRTVDAAAEAMVEGLKQRGRWDNALFVVTSDHGEEFWEHDDFEHGHSLRSKITQVPLLLKAPGVAPGDNSTVVDAIAVANLLVEGDQSALYTLAKSGVSQPNNVAISEGTIYRPQQLSVVTDTHRLVLGLEPEFRYRQLWQLDASGTEAPKPLPADHAEQTTIGDPLFQWLANARGDLEPTRPRDPSYISDPSVFEMLSAMGYLEDDEGDPCQ
jgi:hypothetical protein